MSTGKNIAQSSLLDLFRQELETHSAALGDGLLALEKQPGAASVVDSLMRAAHSIKGAARIVGVPLVVELAHAMEDAFVAAQEGKMTVTHEHIDVFLEAVDLLTGLAETPEDAIPAWLEDKEKEISRLTERVRNPKLSPGDEGGESPSAPPASGDEAAPEKAKVPKEATHDTPDPEARRDVRVSAESLNRLMGLAGEILVESRRLGGICASLVQFQKKEAQLSASLDALDRSLEGQGGHAGLAALRESNRFAVACRNHLREHRLSLEAFAARSDDLAERLYREVLAGRMRPFIDGVKGFSRMVRDLARELGKEVNFTILGEDTEVDRDILTKLEAPLNHILRNALDHGIELPEERVAKGKPRAGALTLKAGHHAGMLDITVSDDGGGIDPEAIRRKVVERRMLGEEAAGELVPDELLEFLLLPGFSTAEKVTRVSGRGVGLDVVNNMVRALRGAVTIDSPPKGGARIHLKLPLSLSVIRVLMAEVGHEVFAFPLHRIDRIMTLPATEIRTLENRQYVVVEGRNIGLVPAHQVLGLERSSPSGEDLSVVMISDHTRRFGLTVDRLLEERDLAVRPLDPRLGKVQDIGAAALLEDGSPVLIVDIDDMVRSIDALLSGGRLKNVRRIVQDSLSGRKRILVVDDSITVREVQRHLLENHGYQVNTAVDGVDGWNAVRSETYDLVISDVDMPRMDGIDLVIHIKQEERLKRLPVMIVSYKDRPQDRKRGLDAGADFYLSKSSFDDETLLEAVVDLIGEA